MLNNNNYFHDDCLDFEKGENVAQIALLSYATPGHSDSYRVGGFGNTNP